MSGGDDPAPPDPNTWAATPGPSPDRDPAGPTEPHDLVEHRTHETWTGEHGEDAAPERPPEEPRTDAFIGQYRIVDVLGEGGMGVVYKAEQRSPRRLVAVKVIRTAVATPAMRRRFEFEAEVLARLDHPGIARIYEAVVEGPRSWFAMEHIDGVPLDDWADDNQATLPRRLELLAAVCDAVHHAHLKGVIHRDLKPGNILVTPEGQPKVLDFGIARATATDGDGDGDGESVERNTRAGQVVGTPAYMSPEQSTVYDVDLDARSDVYALGVIAYELLTGGVLPLDFEGRNLRKVLVAIALEAPRPLAAVEPRLAGDVSAIVHKALEKEPEDRYQSAAALADDIRRHLADQPVLARSGSAIYQLGKFIRRNRMLSVGALGWVATVTVGSAVLAALLWQTVGLYRDAEAASQALAARNTELVRLQARAELATDPTRSLAWLKTLDDAGPELYGLVHEAQTHGVAADLLLGHRHEIRWGAVADSGKAATASYDGTVKLWPVHDRTVLSHAAHGSEARFVGFRPDGAMISAGRDGSLQLRSGGVRELAHTEGLLEVAAMAPDGRMAAGSVDGEVLLIGADDVEIGRSQVPGTVECLAFDPATGDLAIGTDEGGIWRWAGSGEPERIGSLDGDVNGLDFSPEGLLASAGHDGRVRTWPGGATLHSHPHEGRAVAWLDADTLISTDRAGWVMRWQRDAPIVRWRGHTGVVRSLAAASTGRFATGGEDGLVRLWTRDGLSHTLRGHGQEVRHVAFSPDGSWLLSSSTDGSARLWRVPDAPGVLPEPEAAHTALAFGPEGILAWVDSAGGIQRSIDDVPRRWLGHSDESETLVWAGDLLVTGSRDGTVRAWDGMELAWSRSWAERVDQIDATSDGRWVAAAGRLGQVPLWFEDRAEPILLEHTARIEHVAFDPSDRWLATGGEDRALTVWSLDPVEKLARWEGLPGSVTAMAWSPDGTTLAAGDSSGAVSFVAPDPSAEGGFARTERYVVGSSPIHALAWSPSGQLAAGTADGSLIRFDTDGPSEPWTSPTAITALVWGQAIWSGHDDGVVRRWDPRAEAFVELPGPGKPIHDLAISPDGGRIAAAADGREWIWKTHPPAPDAVRHRMHELSRASLGARDDLEAAWHLLD